MTFYILQPAIAILSFSMGFFLKRPILQLCYTVGIAGTIIYFYALGHLVFQAFNIFLLTTLGILFSKNEEKSDKIFGIILPTTVISFSYPFLGFLLFYNCTFSTSSFSSFLFYVLTLGSATMIWFFIVSTWDSKLVKKISEGIIIPVSIIITLTIHAFLFFNVRAHYIDKFLKESHPEVLYSCETNSVEKMKKIIK